EGDAAVRRRREGAPGSPGGAPGLGRGRDRAASDHGPRRPHRGRVRRRTARRAPARPPPPRRRGAPPRLAPAPAARGRSLRWSARRCMPRSALRPAGGGAMALVDELRVDPGAAFRLARIDTGARLGAPSKAAGLERLGKLVERLAVLHDRLYAEARHAVLLVLQGMDASGKDGVIRSVFTGVNPQGCRVESFKEPTATELAHDFLWRVHARCPARGEIAIFNRSHYEDVVVVRVKGLVEERVWRRRYGLIRSFEELLADEGTSVVKVFLHESKDTQRERLQERLDDPEKRWKFRAGDLD